MFLLRYLTLSDRIEADTLPENIRDSIWRSLVSLLLVAAITWFCFSVVSVNSTTVALAYLLAVLAVAARWGLFVSTLTAFASMLLFNYYFLPPIRTFTIADPQNWVALFAFLTTAILASNLSNRASKRASEAIQRQQEMERLYELSRSLLLSGTDHPVASQVAHYVAQVFGCDGAVFFDRASGNLYRAGAADIPVPETKLRDSAMQGTEFQDSATGAFTLPVSLGGHGIGSLTMMGGTVSEAAMHAIANLVAIALEKEQAQAIANLAEAARHNEELKSTLLDAVAHEFKTPLTSIKAATSAMLSSNSQTTAQRELLTVIDEEADRLSGMVTEAIQMARIEAGKLRIDKKPVVVEQLIDEILEQSKTALDGRAVKVEIAPDVPLAEADPDMVHLVLRQLLSNAVKYSPPGSAISFRVTAQNGEIVVGIADRGCGIPEADQAHIFDKFYRARDVRAQIPGTGMGLTIARKIVEAHGGKIWVRSQPRQGSEFFFSLPAAQEALVK
jgi:two-component system sensor histidine kinase KdpD